MTDRTASGPGLNRGSVLDEPSVEDHMMARPDQGCER
jgi:hypothetical protein